MASYDLIKSTGKNAISQHLTTTVCAQQKQTKGLPTIVSGRMTLLGTFTLKIREKTIPITSPRIQTLLAYVARRQGEPQSRQSLAFLLWPNSTESQAHTNLRTLLYRAQAVLPDDLELLQVDSHTVSWYQDTAISLDVAEFEAEINRAQAAAQQGNLTVARAALEHAISLYRGDFMPDCYDEWILAERERLRQSFLSALGQLVSFLEQERQYAPAIACARRLAHLDPLNEAVCLTLMRLSILSGDRPGALRVYHHCASLLQSELGVAPGAALTEAYERLLAVDALPPHDPLRDGEARLVGREQEWRRLQTAWGVANSGRPRLLLLLGEAGIGKTRLAEDLRRWVARQGFVTAATQCYPAEGNLAFTAVSSLIRSDAMRSGLSDLPDDWLSDIARVTPELVGTDVDIPSSSPMTEPWQRHRLFKALARLVLAAKRPVLLLIDDLQWCDQDTLEWLHFLLRYEQNARLLVVGTARVEEIDPDHPLLNLAEALRYEGRVTEFVLNRLDQQASATLAEQVAGRTLPREHAESLFAETEGNPLFIVEMVRAQSGSEREFPQPLLAKSPTTLAGLPPRVLAIVEQRLSRLSPVAHVLIDVAAVIGRSFKFDVLAQVADLEEADLVRGLDELWHRRILREQGSSAYDFTHGKLRAVAYARLSAARQRALHRRVAQALATVNDNEIDAVSGQIAQHFYQAGDIDQAVAYYRRAAAYARNLYANDAAIAHYQHALSLLSESAHQPGVDLGNELGDVLHFVGRYDDARACWQRVLDSLPATDWLARADLCRKLGNAWRDQHHYNEAMLAYDEAEEILNALDREDEARWVAWGQIKLERMNVLYWLGHSDELLHLLEEIRQIVTRHGTVNQRARLHQINALGLIRQSRYSWAPEAVEHAREYLHLMHVLEDKSALPAAHFQFGFIALWALEDLDLAEEQINIALSLAEQHGDVSLQSRSLTYLTIIARRRGQVNETQAFADRSLGVATANQMSEYIGAAEGNLAWVSWRAGDMTATRHHAQVALNAWLQYSGVYMFEGVARWPLIGVSLAADDLKEAVVQAQALLDDSQLRMPEPIESALESALRAMEDGEFTANVRSLLETAADLAHAQNYL